MDSDSARTDANNIRLDDLYGVLADVFCELGGGEKFIREERELLDFRKMEIR